MGDLPEVGSLLPKAVHSPRAELSEIERGDCSVRAGGVDRAGECQAHKVGSQTHTNKHEVSGSSTLRSLKVPSKHHTLSLRGPYS